MVVWMQPMLYSSGVWHRYTLMYLPRNTPCVNTYKHDKPNVFLIILQKICLSAFQYIRLTTKILVNCRHNLNNMLLVSCNTTRSNNYFYEIGEWHAYLSNLSLYIFSGMPIDIVDTTPYVHIYWKTHTVYECISKMFAALGENTLFLNFRIFWYEHDLPNQCIHQVWNGLSDPYSS